MLWRPVEEPVADLTICRKCGVAKPTIAFYLRTGRPHSPCKECRREQRAQAVRRYASVTTGIPYYLNRRRCSDCNKPCSEQATRCKPCAVAYQGRYGLSKDKARLSSRSLSWARTRKGMTDEWVTEMLSAQEWCCAICSSEINGTTGNADHNHSTGQPRGMLCGACNRAIGIMGDSVERLEWAAEYLATA